MNEQEMERRAERAAGYIKRRVSEGAVMDMMLDALTGVDADLKPLIRVYLGLPPQPQPQRRVYQPVLRPRVAPSPEAVEKAGGKRVRVCLPVGQRLSRSIGDPLRKFANHRRAPAPDWQINLYETHPKLWRSYMPDIESNGPGCKLTSSFGGANRKASVPGGITKAVPSNMVRK